MRKIFSVLLYLVGLGITNAQFDSSGFRFLFALDDDNPNILIKYADTNLHVLRNSKKKSQGVLVETHSLIGKTGNTANYLYDNTYSNHFISSIGIEQFTFNNGRLAILSNMGIFYAHSPEDRIQLLSSELTAFEFNDLIFSDSLLYIYRHSTKALNDINFEVFALNIKSKEVVKFASDENVNAILYSNFRDSRLVASHKDAIFRADYVLPIIYRYNRNNEKDTIKIDSQYLTHLNPYCMPDSIIDFLNSCSHSNKDEIEFLDTTFQLKYTHYLCNRQLIINAEKERLMLFTSMPHPFKTPILFALFEFSITNSGLDVNHLFIKNKKTYNQEDLVYQASDVVTLQKCRHVFQDKDSYYMVIENATNLSPYKMQYKEYFRVNYPLQFEKTGIAVVRVNKK